MYIWPLVNVLIMFSFSVFSPFCLRFLFFTHCMFLNFSLQIVSSLHYVLRLLNSLFSYYVKTFLIARFAYLFFESILIDNNRDMGLPGDSAVKNLLANAGDSGSTAGSGRSPGEGNGIPFQYSYLENPMDRAWRATVQSVAKSQTRLSD